MSALATIFGSLDKLTESELRQLYLSIGVRLGFPDGSSGSMSQKKGGSKVAANASSKKAGKSGPSSGFNRGNPGRKSQWANHPLYKEYMRLKKVAETQAREGKTSLNALDTAESRAYKEALTQWVNAKSSFRDHRDGQKTEQGSAQEEEGPAGPEESEEEDDEEGELTVARPSSSAPPALSRDQRSAGPSREPAPPTAGKSSVDKGKGTQTGSPKGQVRRK